MAIIFFILWAICSVAAFVIYHKIFNVIYFDVGSGCLKEIIVCGVLGAIFAAILFYLFNFILKIALILLAIVAAIALIIFLVKVVIRQIHKIRNDKK
jgi:hypothetical protein